MGKSKFQTAARDKVHTKKEFLDKKPRYYDEKFIDKNKKNNVPLAIFTLVVLLIAGGVGIGLSIKNNAEDDPNNTIITTTSTTQTTTTGTEGNPRGEIVMSIGTIIVEFYPEYAPNTVANFLTLTNQGFYDGLTFHRVVADFVAQGGDPNGDGSGGPGYTIDDELIGNPLTHELGAISMAHAGADTGGSQFFIVLNAANCAHLDGVHTVFGKIVGNLNLIFQITEGTVMIDVNQI